MSLTIIGLGLGDEKDVTIRGAECIRRADRVFLEMYTSILGVDTARLERAFEVKIEIADRDLVETSADDVILSPARAGQHVAFLVVGDGLAATTHTDLALRALEAGIAVHVVHNASVMNAIASTGLQLYKFGRTVSVPFFSEREGAERFLSVYDRIASNQAHEKEEDRLHTLCLLDIKVKEPDFDHLMKTGRRRFLPPRFMTVNQCVEQFLAMEDLRLRGVCARDALAVGVARLGQSSQQIVSGTLAELLSVDFGAPLHSLVICGHMEELERAMFDRFRVGRTGLVVTALGASESPFAASSEPHPPAADDAEEDE